MNTNILILDSPYKGALQEGNTLSLNSFDLIAAQTAYSCLCSDEEAIEDSTVVVQLGTDKDEYSFICKLSLHKTGEFGVKDFLSCLLSEINADTWKSQDKSDDELIQALAGVQLHIPLPFH